MAMPIILAALGGLFGAFSVEDVVANLRQAEEVLCGGNRSFYYNVDALGLVHVHDLPSFDPKTAYGVESYTDLAIGEVRNETPPGQWKYALFSEGSADSLVDAVSGIYTARGVGCHNALDPQEQLVDVEGFEKPITDSIRNQWRVWPRWLQQLLNRPITSCADLREYCFVRGFGSLESGVAVVMRAMCPEECGCNSLISGSVFTAKMHGCPSVCTELKPDEKASVPCEDVDPEVPSERRSNILRWFGEIDSVSLPDSSSSWAFSDMFLQGGCSTLVGFFPMLCEHAEGSSKFVVGMSAGAADNGQLMKILTYMCPVSCNCGGVLNPQAAIPGGDACPALCVCEWPFEVAIPEQEAAPNCTVPWVLNTSLASSPISTDAQCCYAMRELAAGMAHFVENPAEDIGAAVGFIRASKAMCTQCRSRCFDAYANASYPGLWGYTTAAFAEQHMGHTMRELFCTASGGRLLRRRLLEQQS